MKKNIFPFTPDVHLIANIDCLLKFSRQPLLLDKFFEKFSNVILNTKLDELEFESENRNSTEYFIIKLKDTNKIELTSKDLSSFGITVTDYTRLIDPLKRYKKNSPGLSLKHVLTKLLEKNNNKNKQINIDGTISTCKTIALDHPENKNKQIDINIFFNFLKKLIAQENDISSKASSIQAERLIEFASTEVNSWLISDDGTSVLGPTACCSKKYNEINNLIDKLGSFQDTSYLATQLFQLNHTCLNNLLGINQTEKESSKKSIEIIDNFQSRATEAIKSFQKSNPLNLGELNILHKILNAITSLIPSFIIQKKTRIDFFQQYTPQKKMLVELERTIQPIKL